MRVLSLQALNPPRENVCRRVLLETGEVEVIAAEKRPLFEKYTGFSNLPFDPQGRLTAVPIEFLKSAKAILKYLTETVSDGFARIVLVVGAAGIGKSTTIEELNNRINDQIGEFEHINGISFGDKLRAITEIQNYDCFIKKVITGKLEPVLEKKGLVGEYKRRMKQEEKRFEDEYVPEIYAALIVLKSIGFELIHFYVDELDLIESAENKIRTNFVHFFRDLGEYMVNAKVPVAITFYAVKEAASMIETAFSEAHIPATMSMEHVHLFATKDEVKSIYKQRVSLPEWKEAHGKTVVPLRASTRNELERKYSAYHPFTAESIDIVYDTVCRDLQEPPDQLSTLRPLFRVFHRGFWFMVDNERVEPIDPSTASIEYRRDWYQDFVEPIISGSRAPFLSLIPTEREDLIAKLGDLNQPALWQLPDIFSLYAQGLQKCMRVQDQSNLLEDLDVGSPQQSTKGNLAFGTSFWSPNYGLNVRFSMFVFREKFDFERFSAARKSFIESKPFAQLNVSVIGLLQANTQDARLACEVLAGNSNELFFFQNQEQVYRVLSQSVVDDTSITRIRKEADLAEMRDFVARLTNAVSNPKDVIEPLENDTVKRLLVSCLILAGKENKTDLRKDDIDQVESQLLQKYDVYSTLANNGFVDETDYILRRIRFAIPPSLAKAAELVLNGKITSDAEGREFFARRWDDIKSYLIFFRIITDESEFSVKELDELDELIKKQRDNAISIKKSVAQEKIPAGKEAEYQKAEACIEVANEVAHFDLVETLKIPKDFAGYLTRAVRLFLTEYANEMLTVVTQAIAEQVPRIEVDPGTITESRELNTEIEKLVTVKNTGKRDLIINKVVSSGKHVTIQTKTPIRVRPQKMVSLTAKMVFKENENSLMIFETNDPSAPKKRIKISMMVVKREKIPAREVWETIPEREEKVSDALLAVLKHEQRPDRFVVAVRRRGFQDAEIGIALVKLLEEKKVRIARS